MTLKEYIKKMEGNGTSPGGVTFSEIIWSGIGSFIGIGLCGYLTKDYFDPLSLTLIIGSFGASAVLVYGAIKSPLAQPRNLLGGHILSGIVGVACFNLLGHFSLPVAAAAAVSIAIMLMHATRTLHPPGGATALIAVIGGKGIHNLGYLYALIPAGLGALVLLIVALLVNNLAMHRKYPEYWW